MRRVLFLISRPLAWALLVPVILYRRLISPWTPASCRFSPTCSAYAEQALREVGLLRAGVLILWRLARCQPFSRGGWDPVPGARDPRAPRCCEDEGNVPGP